MSYVGFGDIAQSIATLTAAYEELFGFQYPSVMRPYAHAYNLLLWGERWWRQVQPGLLAASLASALVRDMAGIDRLWLVVSSSGLYLDTCACRSVPHSHTKYIHIKD